MHMFVLVLFTYQACMFTVWKEETSTPALFHKCGKHKTGPQTKGPGWAWGDSSVIKELAV